MHLIPVGEISQTGRVSAAIGDDPGMDIYGTIVLLQA